MGVLLCSGVNDTAPTSSNLSACVVILFGYDDLLVYTLAPLVYSRSYLIHEFHKVLMLPASLSFLYARKLVIFPAEFHKGLVGIKVGFEFVDKIPLLAFEVDVICLAPYRELYMLIPSMVRHRKVGNHRKVQPFQFIAIGYAISILHFLDHSVCIFEQGFDVYEYSSFTYGAHE